MNIIADASKRISAKLAAIGYVMRSNQARVTMARRKRIRECPILVIECLMIWEAIIMAMRKNFKRIIIERDFQLVVNSSNDKICAHKDTLILWKSLDYYLREKLDFCTIIG